jgi:pimeloyl-ACP methyl ester carboxylesterase
MFLFYHIATCHCTTTIPFRSSTFLVFLLKTGKNDNLIPNRYLQGGTKEDFAKAGCAQIPQSKLVMIPKAGHFVQWEGFDTFNKEVLNFIN